MPNGQLPNYFSDWFLLWLPCSRGDFRLNRSKQLEAACRGQLSEENLREAFFCERFSKAQHLRRRTASPTPAVALSPATPSFGFPSRKCLGRTTGGWAMSRAPMMSHWLQGSSGHRWLRKLWECRSAGGKRKINIEPSIKWFSEGLWGVKVGLNRAWKGCKSIQGFRTSWLLW